MARSIWQCCPSTPPQSLFSSREGANPPQLVVEFGGSAGAAVNAAAVDQNLAPLNLPADTQDSDGDGAPDAAELLNGSNPNVSDTDGDGLFDLWEIENGLSPTDAAGNSGAQGDPDGDGIANLTEQWNGTDPFNPADLPPDRTALPLFLPLVSSQ